MPFITFIIPVYNASKYLSNCIDSILNQEFQDWQIVLVDDKSTDDSGVICDKYADRDDRILCIHLSENKGPGEARNIGIFKAKGDYIFFLDADDAIAANKLSKLFKAAAGSGFPDMIFVKHKELFGSISLNKVDDQDDCKISVKSSEEFLNPFLEKAKLGFYLWQFLMKREKIIADKILFRQSKMGEDIDFTLKNIFAAVNIGEFNSIFYIYRLRLSGSLSTTSGHIKNWNHILKSASELIKFSKISRLTITQKNWVLKNTNFLVLQFEDIAAAIHKEELRKALKEFQFFEETLQLLKKYITENGLFWFIEKYGWKNGPKEFCTYKLSIAEKYLNKKTDSDCYVFPATRKSTRLISILNANGYKFKGLFDNSPLKQGLIFDGIGIFNPQIITDCYENNDKIYVIIYTATERTGLIIAEQLIEYGLNEGQHFIRAGFDDE